MRKIKLSIVIVHYGDIINLCNCLNSILESKSRTITEIIVVDNDEEETIQKELLTKFPKIKYIKSKGNIGYGAAINLGVTNSKGDYILVLNSDTKILAQTINILIQELENSHQAGILAPKLLNNNREEYEQLGSSELTPLRAIFSLSFLNKILPSNPISRSYFKKPIKDKKPYEVDVVPGSAMAIRRKAFEEINGFDSNFFLYFEESDFCKRIKEKGWKIFIVPNSKLIHIWEGNTPRTKKIKKIFEGSRYYYFKKHYGVLNALIVEIFARFSKWHGLLILTLLLALLLRFYRIPQNLIFHGELGHNYLAIKNLVELRQIPLLGPPTSHPWLSFGPLFYWIFAPFLVLFHYQPVAGAYFFAIENLILIVINFYIIKKIFNSEIAAISSYLVAISPLWMDLTRQSRFFSLSIIFLYPFFYFLIKIIQKKSQKFLILGFFLGLSLSFHLTPLFLIPFTLLIFYINKILELQKTIRFLAGLLITQTPFFVYNLTHKFEMLTKFVEWVPYRTLTSQKSFSVSLLYDFITKSFITDSTLSKILFFLLLAIILNLTFKFVKKTKNPISVTLIWFYFGIITLFIHGNPPSHYLMPLYFVPIILLSFALSKSNKFVMLGFLVVITFLNLKFYFSKNWFYIPTNTIQKNQTVPYQLQNQVVDFIVSDAKGQKYNLQRKGFSDQFEGNYAQNYVYLAWLKGNKPSENPQNLVYTIVESPPDISIIKNIK
ncbi:glycosyltransferase [Candidatus Woesebacteria bacterium]|nr:glycosyltransferase [Candidatus Woesebacteria bacterium]QQG47150.1 MAG: glycosyltransferase [Candidatus Woesebacteria bacterium]